MGYRSKCLFTNSYKKSIKLPAIISGLSLLTGTIILTLLHLEDFLLLVGFPLIGLGMGFTVSTFLISTQTLLPRRILGVGTSLLSFLRLMGGAVSAAVLWIPTGSLVRQYNIQSTVGILLSESERMVFTIGISQAMYILTGAAALALILYLLTPDVNLSQRSGDYDERTR